MSTKWTHKHMSATTVGEGHYRWIRPQRSISRPIHPFGETFFKLKSLTRLKPGRLFYDVNLPFPGVPSTQGSDNALTLRVELISALAFIYIKTPALLLAIFIFFHLLPADHEAHLLQIPFLHVNVAALFSSYP